MTEKRILLQVNATIIAGLLILLTIQATIEGGIPFLLELRYAKNSVIMYDEALNDTSIDPILKEEMKRRQAELKLEIMERGLQLQNVPDFWLIELFFNPVATFTFSMFFFIASRIQELYHKKETASGLGLGLSYTGLMIMFIIILFMVILPGV